MAVRMMNRRLPTDDFREEAVVLDSGSHPIQMHLTRDADAAAAQMGWPDGALEMVMSPDAELGAHSHHAAATAATATASAGSDMSALDAMIMDVLNANPDVYSPPSLNINVVGETAPGMDPDSAQLVALLDELNIIASSTQPNGTGSYPDHSHRQHVPVCASSAGGVNNTGSMDMLPALAGAAGDQQIFQSRLGKFERGSARRATIQLGQLRNGARPHSLPPYMRRLQDLNANGSNNLSPLSRTPSQQSLSLATQSLPFVSSDLTGLRLPPNMDLLSDLNPSGAAPNVVAAAAAEAMDTQVSAAGTAEMFTPRPGSIQRRNTINLGRFDNMRQERRHHLYHTPVELTPERTPPHPGFLAPGVLSDVIGALYTPNDAAAAAAMGAPSPINTLDVTLEEVNNFLNEALVRPDEIDLASDLYTLTTPTIIETPPQSRRTPVPGQAQPSTPQAPLPTTPRGGPATPGTVSGDADTAGSEDQPKKQRRRRTFAELNRDVRCPFPDCVRKYASTHSLQQHLRLKHPGEEVPVIRETTMAAQARSAEASPNPAVVGNGDAAAAKQRKRSGSLPFSLDLDILSKLRLSKKSHANGKPAVAADLPPAAEPHTQPAMGNPFDVGRSPPLLLATEAIIEEMMR